MAQRKDDTQEMSMEEILSSIRRYVCEDPSGASHPYESSCEPQKKKAPKTTSKTPTSSQGNQHLTPIHHSSSHTPVLEGEHTMDRRFHDQRPEQGAFSNEYVQDYPPQDPNMHMQHVMHENRYPDQNNPYEAAPHHTNQPPYAAHAPQNFEQPSSPPVVRLMPEHEVSQNTQSHPPLYHDPYQTSSPSHFYREPHPHAFDEGYSSPSNDVYGPQQRPQVPMQGGGPQQQHYPNSSQSLKPTPPIPHDGGASHAFSKLAGHLKQTRQSLQESAATVASSLTLDGFLKDLAIPLIEEWLNKNLNDIVERIVQNEVQRLTEQYMKS